MPRPHARLLPLAILALAACTTTTDFVANSGQPLIGTWSAASLQFQASEAGATLKLPCLSVEFPPIVLDDTLGFSAVGVIASAAGLVTVKPGDPYVLSGHAGGKQLVVNSSATGTVTLSLGANGQPLICNA
ncbi:MAG: hypothetical protein KGL38_06055 [Gemmatimonadota bacterium]|nr:hypothetical protein [Gemmatimonadota bacterium]